MAGGEYLLALLAIITGLAISDMVVSLHGLLLNRRLVKWDWLTLMSAAFVFISIVNSWGISFRSFNQDGVSPPLWSFLIVLCQVIPFYLAARAVLPDHVRVGDEVDLAGHYAFISRYFWAAISLSAVNYLALSVVYGGFRIIIEEEWPTILALSLMAPLIIWPDRRLHRILVPILFAFLCVKALPARLLG